MSRATKFKFKDFNVDHLELYLMKSKFHFENLFALKSLKFRLILFRFIFNPQLSYHVNQTKNVNKIDSKNYF